MRSGILIVEDDDDTRNTMMELFGDRGYAVSGARHGKEALEQLHSGAALPAMIFLDIMMPVMDGRAFRAEQLLDPKLRDIPVVVVTANANLADMERELATSHALRKPVKAKQLFELAARYCDPATAAM